MAGARTTRSDVLAVAQPHAGNSPAVKVDRIDRRLPAVQC